MSLRNTHERWGWLAKLFHWVMAILIIALALVGTYMANFLDDMVAQFELTQIHKSFGFVVFAMAVLRVLWRWANPVSPRPPGDRPLWERWAVHGSHGAMYVLMFAIPVSGWLMASASILNDADAYPARIPNMVFGLFELPDPFRQGSDALTDTFHVIHAWSVYLLAALLLVHIGAALRHHFVDRDDVLRRMLPGRSKSQSDRRSG